MTTSEKRSEMLSKLILWLNKQPEVNYKICSNTSGESLSLHLNFDVNLNNLTDFLVELYSSTPFPTHPYKIPDSPMIPATSIVTSLDKYNENNSELKNNDCNQENYHPKQPYGDY